MATAPQKPRVVSGIGRLNNTLDDIYQRINATAERIEVLANQFGAPEITDKGRDDLSEAPETTNARLLYIDTAIRDLERVISRIDNQ